MTDLAYFRTLSNDAKKEMIAIEKEKIKFYESFILPISTAVLAIAFTDEIGLLAKSLQWVLLVIGFFMIAALHYLRQLSLIYIRSYLQLLN